MTETVQRSAGAAPSTEAATPREAGWLAVRDLSLSFGGVHALQGVSFDVARGAVHAIIGPNGAGKTTLLNCISGLYRPQGSIQLERVELTTVRPHARIAMGIARTFQNIALLPEATVLDNVLLGGHPRLKSGIFRSSLYWSPMGCSQQEKSLGDEAMGLLEQLGMAHLAFKPAGQLAYGQQKQLELGRALLAHPKLLLLDEPMAGMTRTEKDKLCDMVLRINRERGITIVMIEHDMSVVHAVSTSATVIDFGKKIAEGSPQQVTDDPQVRRAYLGEDA